MEFINETKEVTFELDISSGVTYFAIANSLSNQLRILAHKKGISANTLLYVWIQEKLKEQKS